MATIALPFQRAPASNDQPCGQVVCLDPGSENIVVTMTSELRWFMRVSSLKYSRPLNPVFNMYKIICCSDAQNKIELETT